MKKLVFWGGVLLAALGALFLFATPESGVARVLANLSELRIDTPQIDTPRQSAVLFAAGDMMFDRSIRLKALAKGEDFLFSCIDQLMQSADASVGNLEGPITESASMSVGSVPGTANNFVFTFPTSTALLLKRHNFVAVGLGNNHILNFGLAGLYSTQNYLKEAGVGYFGGVAGDETIFETKINEVPIAMIGYNEFGGSSPEYVAEEIKKEVAAGYRVVVYAHWGDEYIDSSPRLRPIATLFARAGASAVIGGHPHVVLGHEYIGDTLVYYSLGNFIFDQYFNEQVRSGLALMLDIPRAGKVTATEYPTQILVDGRVCPLTAGGPSRVRTFESPYPA